MMANKDKHTAKPDYMSCYEGSKAERIAEEAKRRYHRPKRQKRKLKYRR